MRSPHTDRAVQAAIQALAEAMREVVKEAVREELSSHMAWSSEIRKPTEEQAPADPLPRDALVRMKEMGRLTGLGSSSIYRMMAEKAFPEPLRLGENTVAWRWGEVLDWMASRPRVRSRATRRRNAS